MARKQKILESSTGHLTKLQQEAKYKAEILATDGFEMPQATPPSYLTNTAQNEYRRIYKDINKLPIRMLDHAELELYCAWYAIYKDTMTELKELPDDKSPDKLISRMNKATVNVKSLASDLGMTVNARLQIQTPQDNDKDESKTMKGMFS